MPRSLAAAAAFALFSLASLPSLAATEPPPVAVAPAVSAEPVQVASVNLNTADAAALSDGLLGIGEKKAQAIVEYREANGPFATVDQLLEVKGIGAGLLEKNRDRIRLE